MCRACAEKSWHRNENMPVFTPELARIHEMQRKDASLAPLITNIETKTLPDEETRSRSILQQADQFLLDEHGILQHLLPPMGRSRPNTKIQLIVPTDLRFEILKFFHGSPLGGHLGFEKT